MTPISAVFAIKSVSSIKPKHDGPIRIPARSAHTTCGILTLLVIAPRIFVVNMMIAMLSKKK